MWFCPLFFQVLMWFILHPVFIYDKPLLKDVSDGRKELRFTLLLKAKHPNQPCSQPSALHLGTRIHTTPVHNGMGCNEGPSARFLSALVENITLKIKKRSFSSFESKRSPLITLNTEVQGRLKTARLKEMMSAAREITSYGGEGRFIPILDS